MATFSIMFRLGSLKNEVDTGVIFGGSARGVARLVVDAHVLTKF